jgi:hypothetical protein
MPLNHKDLLIVRHHSFIILNLQLALNAVTDESHCGGTNGIAGAKQMLSGVTYPQF